MPATIQEQKQIIDSLIQNLNFETDPEVMKSLYKLKNEIWTYWTLFLDATYDYETKEFKRK